MKNLHTFYDNILQSPFAGIRTDLAEEVFDPAAPAGGTAFFKKSLYGTEVSHLRILPGEGERTLKKKAGDYVSLKIPGLHFLTGEKKEALISALSHTLTAMSERVMKSAVGPDTTVLVAGLGNRAVGPDSIGPRTADKVAVTGFAAANGGKRLFELIGCSCVCAIHPGVMGQTGIEAAAMIKGVCDHVRPDLVIAIDALCSRFSNNLFRTVQLSDTGIEPASGIGLRQGAVDSKAVGCPVIAMGVPTVADLATLLFDSLREAGIEDPGNALSKTQKGSRGLFVCPSDCDVATEEISFILASAINRTFLSEALL